MDDALTDEPGPPRRRLARRVLAALLAPLSLLLLGPLGLLTVVAETRQGRLVGWLALAILGAATCASFLIWTTPRPRVWAVGLVGCLLVASALTLAIARRPRPAGEGGDVGLRSIVLGPAARMRAGLLGSLPEADLVGLGATLLGRLGFVAGIRDDHARRIRVDMIRAYREVEADPAGRGLPSVTHLALGEILGLPIDAGHSFAYVPETAPGERLGLVVFLHGNAGNFKILPWAWRSFAEAERFAILCPTFGYGLWGEGGVEAVERAVADALRRLPADPGLVYLGGISDGGVGVTRSARAHPSRYRGLIYVSPTMRPDELGSPAFVDAWRGRPVLVLQGDADLNVRKADVDPAVALLRSAGVDVTYRVFEGEDHFLFFGRSADVLGAIAGWAATAGREARPGGPAVVK